MPSASRQAQLAVAALCAALLAGSLTGCETTQENAAAKQAESAQILKARAKRRHHGTKSPSSAADGTNSPTHAGNSARRHGGGDKSAHRQEGEG